MGGEYRYVAHVGVSCMGGEGMWCVSGVVSYSAMTILISGAGNSLALL